MRCFVVLFLGFSVLAQQPNFAVRSRLVLVPVVVTDAHGHVVDGLESSDFTLLDNGIEQKTVVDTIATGVAPIALVIAVQSSGISAPVLDKVRKIAGMIGPMVTGERGCAALLSFAERVMWLQQCTHDPDQLQNAFRKLQTGDAKSARMLDAVHESVDNLRSYPNARRILLLISESKDRGSQTELMAVTGAAQAAGVVVYAATYSPFKTAFTSKTGNTEPGLRDPDQPLPNPDHTMDRNQSNQYDPKLIAPQNSVDLLGSLGELTRLHKADAAQMLTVGTGGTKLPFLRQKGLEEAIEKLGAELHTEYLIGFSPDDPAPGYHHIDVRVKRDKDLHIRARPGYWSEAFPRK